jgi:DNA-binding transcriptional MerR regulator
MSKAPSAFRTISEVSDELDVPKHVLRFWEMKFPQIKPMKRGGGRRYYRPEDLALLKGICHLLHAEAYTIKGVQKILRERGVESVKQIGATPADAKRKKPTRTAAPGAKKPASKPTAAAKKTTGTKSPARRSVSKPDEAEFALNTDVVDALSRAITELQACRSALLGAPTVKKPKARNRSAGQHRN